MPEDIYDRLQALADKTGRTATFYIRETIEKHLEDLEDIYLAEQATGRLNHGESRVVNAGEFWRGLDD